MAANDDAQILQLSLKAEGAKSADWEKVRVSDLTALNAILRQMQETVFKLNGRGGDSAIRSGLTVSGGVSSGGTLAGTALTLGVTGLTPSNPSFAPDVEAALTPVALDYAPLLGARADAHAPRPFTWTISEHFLGGTVATSGSIGELGWTATGIFTLGGSEASHPGFVNLDNTATLYLAGTVVQSSLSYIGMTLRPNSITRVADKFGFISPGATTNTGVGAYFFFDTAAPTWETVTRSAAGITQNDSGIAVVAGDWVLLELVFTAGFVDFFLNRKRLFRHQGTSVSALTSANLGYDQELVVAAPNTDYDRFIACGRGIGKIWA